MLYPGTAVLRTRASRSGRCRRRGLEQIQVGLFELDALAEHEGVADAHDAEAGLPELGRRGGAAEAVAVGPDPDAAVEDVEPGLELVDDAAVAREPDHVPEIGGAVLRGLDLERRLAVEDAAVFEEAVDAEPHLENEKREQDRADGERQVVDKTSAPDHLRLVHVSSASSRWTASEIPSQLCQLLVEGQKCHVRQMSQRGGELLGSRIGLSSSRGSLHQVHEWSISRHAVCHWRSPKPSPNAFVFCV